MQENMSIYGYTFNILVSKLLSIYTCLTTCNLQVRGEYSNLFWKTLTTIVRSEGLYVYSRCAVYCNL